MTDELEKQRRTDYDTGASWERLNRTNYLIVQKRVLCSMPAWWQKRFWELLDQAEGVLDLEGEGYTHPSFEVKPYSDVAYNGETGDYDDYTYCTDPLADYRHTPPIPLKEGASLPEEPDSELEKLLRMKDALVECVRDDCGPADAMEWAEFLDGHGYPEALEELELENEE